MFCRTSVRTTKGRLGQLWRPTGPRARTTRARFQLDQLEERVVLSQALAMDLGGSFNRTGIVSDGSTLLSPAACTPPLTPAAGPLTIDMSVPPAALVTMSGPNIVNVKTDFGAAGDGVTDDYNALKRAAAYISSHPGTTLVFPPGTYEINRYATNTNGVGNIIFNGASDFRITGYQAKIDVEGDFRRTGSGGENQISPFLFVGCSNFALEGFELDGHVTQMTRDPGLAENFGGTAVITEASRDYIIQDMNIHDFSTDGIMLGGASSDYRPVVDGVPQYVMDHDAVVTDVRCANNARNGLSVIHLQGGTFSNNQFLNSGRVGSYGGHLPMAGVDVEPDYHPPYVQDFTSGLVFDRCLFQGNLGCQFMAGNDYSKDITLSNSRFVTSYDSTAYRGTSDNRGLLPQSPTILMEVPDGLIDNCDIDTKQSSVLVAGGFGGDTSPNGTGPASTVIRNTRIQTEGDGLISWLDRDLTITNTTITGVHRQPLTGVYPPSDRDLYSRVSFVPYIRNGRAIFTGNTVFLPRAAYNPDPQTRDGSQVGHYASVIDARLALGNQFTTDLPPDADPSGNARFLVHYQNGTRIFHRSVHRVCYGARIDSDMILFLAGLI